MVLSTCTNCPYEGVCDEANREDGFVCPHSLGL